MPMDKRGEEPKLFDNIHHSDGLSLLDLPFILGSFLALLGGIYGFVLEWGPIVWGLIGFACGFAAGLIIECSEQQTETVKDILWSHNALGVRKLELKDDTRAHI